MRKALLWIGTLGLALSVALSNAPKGVAQQVSGSQPGPSYRWSLSANGAVNVSNVKDLTTCAVTVYSGSTYGGGQITFKLYGDNGNQPQAVSGQQDPGNSSPAPTQTVTSSGIWFVPVGGATQFSIVLTGATSPSITGWVNCGKGGGGSGGGGGAVSGTVNNNCLTNCTPPPAPTRCPSPAPVLPPNCGIATTDLNSAFDLSKMPGPVATTSITAGSTTYQVLTGAAAGTNYYPYCVATTGNTTASVTGQLFIGTSSGSATAVSWGQTLATSAGNATLFYPPTGGSATAGACMAFPVWLYLPGGSTTTNLYFKTGTNAPSAGSLVYVFYLVTNQ